MFRYSIRAPRARIDVNAIDIVEALVAMLRIHCPNIGMDSYASNDVMALVDINFDCDIYRDEVLVLTLGPNHKARVGEDE